MNAIKIFIELCRKVSVTDIIIFLPGLTLLCIWLLKTSLGRKALADSTPRRNSMPFYLPFIPLFIWFGPVGVAAVIAEKLLPSLPKWQETFFINLIYCIGGLAVAALIILLARVSFARRLKGFGLNSKTIVRDFFAGAANLLAVWPLMIAMIILTTALGKVIGGEDFEMQQHQGLELITEYSQLPLRILIIVLVVVMAPVLEEMLFRGLFQTMLRGAVKNAWTAIILISAIFAMLHPWTHWPALFALGMCLGYAYEKSGSLLRPIFIHSLFNGITVIATLYSVQ